MKREKMFTSTIAQKSKHTLLTLPYKLFTYTEKRKKNYAWIIAVTPFDK